MPAGANVCAIFKETCLGPRRGRSGGGPVGLARRVPVQSAMPLTPLPMAGFHAPAIALSYPLMANPMVSGTGRRPVARDPFMPIANPVPIAAQPNISRRRCDTDDLNARHRRRDHHHPIGIVPLIGNDHAPSECHRKHQAGRQTRDQALTLIHNEDHMLLRVLSDLTCCVSRR